MSVNRIHILLYSCSSYIHITGAQPEMFQGRGGFVKLGHFDKHFVKNLIKKGPTGKISEFFLLDTLKTTFSMANLTQEWLQSRPFLAKSGLFF